MGKRTDIQSIMIIGAGPIVIGQACEFDYSGTQACRALKEEGYRVVLVNSNPATIMTDPTLADATYVEPITPEMVAKIIEAERPDALLATMGGQTALNTAMALARDGVLERLGVELIGANFDAIDKAEDRLRFREAMAKIGLESPKSVAVSTMAEAQEAIADVGLPAIIRPSFTLGGTGGGIAYNRAEFQDIVESGLDASPVTQVLIEESVLGWKEYEMEVVRDRADNCIIICSIENVDPMGVHTGDSITVAPALTLTDKEYQILRNASIAVLREIGVDTGGSNVQFAVNPENGRVVIIEMNPRVSRSSALASKATGFPIAKIAAKLAVGYTLDELQNDITGVTPASFEPTIDYVVTKIPRFTFEKFADTDPLLTTAMKSVGEVMAVGRCFAESLQKALRSLETGLNGLNDIAIPGNPAGGYDRDAVTAALGKPTPDRLLVIAQALRCGMEPAEVTRATAYDPWFVEQLADIVAAEAEVIAAGLPEDSRDMTMLKGMGFSDARLGELTGKSEAQVAAHRRGLNVAPVYKRIDTCAAEFASQTPYMYSTYESDAVADLYQESVAATGAVAVPSGFGKGDEALPGEWRKVIILGGGPNRIGQGIEFDYCCCHAVYALEAAGFETIMLNCNPETVSTDYDTSDRLYFEPLTAEDVIEVCRLEQSAGDLAGVILQFGGQTPLKLARALEEAEIPILGTSPAAIDLAEDREQFTALLAKLDLRQPANAIATDEAEAVAGAEAVGYPVLLRPSFVLGGRAMEIIHDADGLRRYITQAVHVSGDSPVLIDSFLQDAVEVDVDAVADHTGAVVVAGVMQHIEQAGIHSGDSACSLPPYSLSDDITAEIRAQTEQLARALNVVGLMNVQYAVKDGTVYVIEVNPRASRTVPFVAKATGLAVAKIGARVMAGATLSELGVHGAPAIEHVAVKEAVFPFARFPGVDTLLGPEMKSTGEVMGIDADFARAFAKSQLAAGNEVPTSGTAFISVRDQDKEAIVGLAQRLLATGYELIATRGTAAHLSAHGIAVTTVNKVLEGRPHVVDAMLNNDVQLMFNTTEGGRSIADSYTLRRAALTAKVPYYTTVAGGLAVVGAIEAIAHGGLEVAPLQSYFIASF